MNTKYVCLFLESVGVAVAHDVLYIEAHKQYIVVCLLLKNLAKVQEQTDVKPINTVSWAGFAVKIYLNLPFVYPFLEVNIIEDNGICF